MVTKQRSSAKADFVRSFPVSVPVNEVVEQAKAAGLSVSPAHVYGVRKTMGAGRTKVRRETTVRPSYASQAPMSMGSTVGRSAPAAGSKKAFVLSFPADTPAQEVVRAAAERGIDLSPGYLYWVRSEATRTGRRMPGPARETAGAPSGAGRGSATDAERIIVETALRVVGIERAIAVLEAARGRLGRLLEE